MKVLILVLSFVLIGCVKPDHPGLSDRAAIGAIIIIEQNPEFFGKDGKK